MARIKSYDKFLEEFTFSSPKPETDTETTPTIPRPRTRPGVTPTEIPSEEDAPLASAQDVIDRLDRIYQNSTKKDKEEIDSYFQK
jgi:hypothetical protein